MGNLSSCATGYMMSSSNTLQQAQMVRVLLVDGSVLKLKAATTVSTLLAEYPNHVICCLASLKPGLQALSSLLPDEKLQLGGLYLLLPLKSRAQKAGTACKSELAMRKRGSSLMGAHERSPLPTKKSSLALTTSSVESSRNGDFGTANKMGAHERSPLPTRKSHMGSTSSAESRRNGDLGMASSSSAAELSTECEVGPQINGELQAIGNVPAKAYNSRGTRQGERRENCKKRNHGDFTLHSHHDHNSVNGKLCSVRSRRLCNTPELQRASVLLRRRSAPWTPKLQPINERR